MVATLTHRQADMLAWDGEGLRWLQRPLFTDWLAVMGAPSVADHAAAQAALTRPHCGHFPAPVRVNLSKRCDACEASVARTLADFAAARAEYDEHVPVHVGEWLADELAVAAPANVPGDDALFAMDRPAAQGVPQPAWVARPVVGPTAESGSLVVTGGRAAMWQASAERALRGGEQIAEIAVSECGFGCKVYAARRGDGIVFDLIHSRIYGCPQGGTPVRFTVVNADPGDSPYDRVLKRPVLRMARRS